VVSSPARSARREGRPKFSKNQENRGGIKERKVYEHCRSLFLGTSEGEERNLAIAEDQRRALPLGWGDSFWLGREVAIGRQGGGLQPLPKLELRKD